MTKDQIQKAIQKHGTVTAAAKSLGISRQALRRMEAKGTGPAKGSAQAKGKSLTAFRDEYDKDTVVPKKLRAALASLGAGWEYEVQFSRAAGVSLADLAASRDAFAEFVVQLPGGRRAWAGKKAVAEKMRRML